MLLKAPVTLTYWQRFISFCAGQWQLPFIVTESWLCSCTCTHHRESEGGRWWKTQLNANNPWHNVNKGGECQSRLLWFQRKPKKESCFLPLKEKVMLSAGTERNSCGQKTTKHTVLHLQYYFSTLFILEAHDTSFYPPTHSKAHLTLLYVQVSHRTSWSFHLPDTDMRTLLMV